MSAYAAGAIIIHSAELEHSDFLSFRLHITHQAFPYSVVTARIEEAAFGFKTVTTCASGFLLVVLKRLGHAGVNKITHIGLVDPHPECNGCHNRLDLFSNK